LVGGEWNHIAVVRQSGVFRMYVNGIQDAVVSDQTATSLATLNCFDIGRSQDGSSPEWNGNISNFRVIKGTCLYPNGTTFIPPSGVLTAVAGTSLLACQSNKFTDDSGNNIAITPAGNAHVTTRNPFKRNTGRSIYFDGNGDYLNIPAGSPTMAFGISDFTIEFWALALHGAAQTFFDNRSPDTANAGFDITLLATSNYLRFSTSGTAYIDGDRKFRTGQWNHIMLTRSGNSFKLYLNGDQTGPTYTGSNSQNFTNTNTRIGSGAVGPMWGYIKDLRITRGAVRTITVPSVPLELK
jgi:hypothetical protein